MSYFMYSTSLLVAVNCVAKTIKAIIVNADMCGTNKELLNFFIDVNSLETKFYLQKLLLH